VASKVVGLKNTGGWSDTLAVAGSGPIPDPKNAHPQFRDFGVTADAVGAPFKQPAYG
jgi:hypothetical protein